MARLQLQTLLETYEDSEYSAQAKYAYADTFYLEGGAFQPAVGGVRIPEVHHVLSRRMSWRTTPSSKSR